MLEIEVIGIDQIAPDGERAVGLVVPTAAELERLCALAIASAGIDDSSSLEYPKASAIARTPASLLDNVLAATAPYVDFTLFSIVWDMMKPLVKIPLHPT